VNFYADTALAAGVGEVTIVFPGGVVLPATMAKTSVAAGVGATMTGLLIAPTITASSRTVNLKVPVAIGAGTTVTVFFSQVAGIVNPAKSAAASAGKVSTSADAVASGTGLSFSTTISLGGKTSQVAGGAVTVTIGGFTSGSTVYLTGGVTGKGNVGSDLKATISGTKSGTAAAVVALDLAGLTATSASIAVKPELTVTASGKAGDTITLTGKNFTTGSTIAAIGSIDFGGAPLAAGTVSTALPYTLISKDQGDSLLNDFVVKVLIPSTAKAGINQVKVTDAGAVSAKATIEVVGRSVTITPDSGPPGTKVTITGSGFPKSIATNVLNTANIVGGTAVTGLYTNSSGELPGHDTYKIPSSATAGTVTLTVSIRGADGADATGSDKFTVTARALTVVPSSGPRGTAVLVTGTKFTAGGTVAANAVIVDGVATTHTMRNLPSSGSIPAISITIPTGAGIGSKYVTLTDNMSLLGKTKFTVTQPTVSLGLATANIGQNVPVTGAGWLPNTSVTVTLKSGSTAVATSVVVSDGSGGIDTTVLVPSTVYSGSSVTLNVSAADSKSNTGSAKTLLSIPGPKISLSASEANVGDVVDVTASGFSPLSALSVLTIGGADVRTGVVTTDSQGGLVTSFTVPGIIGSNIVTVAIGGVSKSTSISVVAAAATPAAATTTLADIFADVIANSDNLVRVWRFSNADQSWEFYDPRPAFESANTLEKSGTGDIVWVNVTSEQAFQSTTLFPGWNLISLD
jgi:hypothetical protein